MATMLRILVISLFLSGCITNEKAELNLAKGKDYQSTYQQQAGVVSLDNGLQYKVLVQGSGEKPNRQSSVQVHYQGKLVDGTEFDSSYKRGAPIVFGVTQVIKGWTQALLLMQEGSTWEVVIPANLAYGNQGAGRSIGPGETLIFTIQLIKVIH